MAPSWARSVVAGAPAVDVRITGWGPWKTVIVPPNAHVVHTGAATPGRSTSARRVVPLTTRRRTRSSSCRHDADDMINAYCICKELQACSCRATCSGSSRTSRPPTRSSTSPTSTIRCGWSMSRCASRRGRDQGQGRDHGESTRCCRQAAIIEELTARLRSVAEAKAAAIPASACASSPCRSRKPWCRPAGLGEPAAAVSRRARPGRAARPARAETVVARHDGSPSAIARPRRLASDAELARLRSASGPRPTIATPPSHPALPARAGAERQTAQLRHDTALATAESRRSGSRATPRSPSSAPRGPGRGAPRGRARARARRAAARRGQPPDRGRAPVPRARQRIANETSHGALQAA